MPKLREEAKERQKEHGGTAPGKTLPAKLPEVFSGESREKAASVAAVSPRTMQAVITTHEKGIPELAAELKKGTVAASVAAEVARGRVIGRRVHRFDQ